ncbi:hypothetical protein R3P38DRAFT_2764149 [Favolaschia claudopus]|uniref:Uncharacterized protein n=1 Tax=Favolaschia claudopus TaxID=2862362 RepID=A0AAW0D8Y9_9AGAR
MHNRRLGLGGYVSPETCKEWRQRRLSELEHEDDVEREGNKTASTHIIQKLSKPLCLAEHHFRSSSIQAFCPHCLNCDHCWGHNTPEVAATCNFPVCRIPHPSYTNWQEHMGPIDGYFSEASFFGGSPHTVSWWRETYYAYHDHYLRQGHFVGKDQNLIFSLFLLFPSRIIAVWLDDPDAPAHKELGPVQDTAHEGFLGSCGENWFYYQFWLANLADRLAMNEIWEKAALWSWGGWRRRRECRLTRVVWVKELLHRQFGKDWRPPMPSIAVPGNS